jgi:hypothetical protein
MWLKSDIVPTRDATIGTRMQVCSSGNLADPRYGQIRNVWIAAARKTADVSSYESLCGLN